MKIANIYPFPAEINGQVPKLPSGILQGGAETGAFEYAEALSIRGHKVTYYTGKYDGITNTKVQINQNFNVEYLPLILKNNISLTFSFRLFFKLLFGDFDVIHSHQIPQVFSLIGGIVAKLKRKKMIITFCGMLPMTTTGYLLTKIVSFLSNAIIVQNEYARKIVEKYVDKKKIYEIPYALDLNQFKKFVPESLIQKYKPNNEIIILSVSRLIPSKGIDVILHAVNLLKHKYNIKYLIVGTGSQESYLKDLVEKLDLKNNVIFTGYIKTEELPYYYSLADIFILASTNYDQYNNKLPDMCEIFSFVLGEAMSCGTPVIASNFQGIPNWIIPGFNGLLFHERDYNDLSSKIEILINNKNLANKLIRNSRKLLLEIYSYDAVIKQYEKIYNTRS